MEHDLPYEELVEMIAHIKAAQGVIDLEECEGELLEIMDDLHNAQNALNRMRLASLGNGMDRPYSVAEITHVSGGPWDLATQAGGNYARIPNELIKQHYQSKRHLAEQGAAVG